MEKLEKMDSKDISVLLWGLELLVDMLGQTVPADTSPNPPRHLLPPEEDLVSNENL
jgi:hypothetical protein